MICGSDGMGEDEDHILKPFKHVAEGSPGRVEGRVSRLPAVLRVLVHLSQIEDAAAGDLLHLGCSMSTVYRAINLLSDHDIIEKASVESRTGADGPGRPAALWRLRTR